MTECLDCNYIETAPVVLEDGRVVCATCPDAKPAEPEKPSKAQEFGAWLWANGY